MSEYTLTVGLEIHAELNTATKMFCDSRNDPDEKRPNINICPVCMGHPGSLPVINKRAVESVLRLGTALGGKIADFTEFDRKNYFYPDIPKGYQISQYKFPLVTGGELLGVKITRIHLEEDTARSFHDKTGDSLLDFNRAGVPLLELVTEPVITDARLASRFAAELQLLLNYLGVSEANMEKGEMRIEANVSVSRDKELGTKVEVKNLNSFKAVERAIAFEAARHIELLEAGKVVTQETRGWDEDRESTFPQREKEESHDYRYFPDPDLPKLFISEVPEWSEKRLRESLPELPWEKRERYKRDYGIKDNDIEIYVTEPEWGRYFEEVAEILKEKSEIQLASNYITTDLERPMPPESFVEVIRMIGEGVLSSRGAKDILKIIEEEGGDPKTIAAERGLMQKSDEGELKVIAEKIISNNREAAEEYKKGKTSSLQFLIGQAMKETKGAGNPQLLKEIFQKLLQ